MTYGTKMTQLAFKRRFPNVKWRAARGAARAGNEDLIDFFEDFDLATYIDTADEKMVYALGAMTTEAFPVEIRLTAPEAATALASVTDPDELPTFLRIGRGLPAITP